MFGSYGYSISFPDFVIQPDMTAIGIVGIAAGFILGADGRKRLDDDSRQKATAEEIAQECDDAQKIFEITGEDISLAYALTGSIADSAGFDLLRVIREGAEALRTRTFPDANKYLRQLGGKINKGMNLDRRAGKLQSFPQMRKVPQTSAWSIADVFVVGFYKQQPCFSILNFFHYHQISEFRVIPCPLLNRLLSGSEIIIKAMYDASGLPLKDSPFFKYARELRNPTLDQAEECVKGFIEASSSPLALEMDPAFCKGIGGHIHIAEVTSAGFKWRVPPAHFSTD